MSSLRALSESLGEKLERLCERLNQLGAALREELAREVGATAAEAVRAAVRRLLDALRAPAARPPGRPAWYGEDEDWAEPCPDPWAPEDELGGPRRGSRWRFALTAAWQAASGLWRRGYRLPAL